MSARTMPLCPDPSGGGRGERAGAFVPGALGAALLAAALAFPAGEAQARNECGALSSSGAATCSDQAYANGIRYDTGNGFNAGIAGPVTLTVTGGPATTITGATSSLLSWERGGIIVRAGPQGSGDSTSRAIALTVGSGSNAVAIVERASVSNDGVNVDQHGTAADGTTVTLGSGVTIGTASAPMVQYGVTTIIYDSNNSGVHSITSAATIHSVEVGLLMGTVGSGNTQVTNTGSITIRTTGGRTSSSKHGIYVFDWSHRPQDLDYGGASRTVDTTAAVTNTGSITVGHAQAHGIRVDAHGLGLYRIVNSGSGARGITASGANGRGVYVDARYHTGAAGSAAVEIENSGRITTSGASGYGVYVETVGGDEDAFQEEGQHKGNVAITNSGSISSANHAIFVNADMGDVSVTHSGGSITSTAADGIRVRQGGTGDAAVTVSSGAMLTSKHTGIHADLGHADNAAGQVKIIQGGTISGRTGVHAAASRASAEGETRAATAQPVIDVAWTGTFTQAEAGSGSARAAAGGSGGPIVAHEEVPEAETAMATRWGTAAGIEAHALSWRDVAAKVAEGDDPGTFADATAVTALFAADADADSRTRAAAAIASFRAQLALDDGAIPDRNSVDADNDDEVTDAEITAFLSMDDADRRTFLRNILMEHLSAAETEVLRAVVTNTGLDAALAAGGAIFSEDWKTAVRGFLNRHNTGDIRVAMTAGSIDSRGDGIRAYYATPNDDNGAIDVTVAAGATVSGGMAGIYVANAGATGAGAERMVKQSVTVNGTVEGGTDAAVHLSGGGRLTVGAMGRVQAGSSGVGVLADGGGDLTATVSGRVTGDVRVNGGGDLTLNVEKGGAVTGTVHSEAGDLDLTVAGRVAGDLRAPSGGTLKLSVLEGGRVPGTVHDPVSPLTVAGSIGRLLYPNGATVTVAATGALTGVEVDGRTEALRNDAGDLDLTVEGMVTGEIRSMGDGDHRIDVNGAIENSLGNGIHASYATQRDDNGAIDVTIAAGATVTGGVAGIYVANAGVGTDGILKQTVTVHGTVTGGRDAAVHLSGGGRLTVGEMGRVLAGSSGVGVLVNDPGPAHITIDGLVRGAEGGAAAVHLTGGGSVTVGPRGRVQANEAAWAIRSDDEPTSVIVRTGGDGLTQENVREAAARIEGGIEGGIVGSIASPTGPGPEGMSERGVTYITVVETVDDGVIGRVPTGGFIHLPLDERGEPDFNDPAFRSLPGGRFDCDWTKDGHAQCRLYEALPSVLLAMNDLPTWAERMSAARDGKGGWARVETARGEWKADSSTRPNVAYDHRRHGVRAGMDFAVGEAGRVGRAGVSVHGLLGSAEMASPMGGNDKIELSGRGLGVNATAALAGDVHVDAQAAVTWYDVDLELATGRSLKKGAKGMGYALGVEVVGRRMPVMLPAMDGVSVTPRGGLLWSKVSLDDFTQEMEGSTVRPRISVEDADSLAGRVGVMVEGAVGSEDAPGRVFGSVDVEHEFKDETSVNVTGNRLLETTARSNGVRLGLGGELAMREDAVLRARADYTTRGGDTNEYGVGVELNLRF